MKSLPYSGEVENVSSHSLTLCFLWKQNYLCMKWRGSNFVLGMNMGSLLTAAIEVGGLFFVVEG